MLLVKEKAIVVPGEVVAKGKYLAGKGIYQENDSFKAKRLGLLSIEKSVLSIIPFSGKYIPKVGDKVIGRIEDIFHYGWKIDLGVPFTAMLPIREAITTRIAPGTDLSKFFALGDWIAAKIIAVGAQKVIELSTKGPGLGKLQTGRVISVNPYKIPRIIGKEGSMISLIKSGSRCTIELGQNGLIWLKGQPEAQMLAIQAIKLVEAEAHIPGLTDRVKELFHGIQKKV